MGVATIQPLHLASPNGAHGCYVCMTVKKKNFNDVYKIDNSCLQIVLFVMSVCSQD